jgi:predicted outer membrane protein
MRRTAFSLVLAAEMFVLTGMASAQTTPAQPAQPAQPARPAMPDRTMDPADHDRMQKEWDSMKKEWEALTPEARILSIIHAKNQEEVELGRLAQEKASAPGVKEYAAMMVRDHTEADSKLTTLAANEKISLWDTARTDRALKLHKMFDKGKDAKDKDREGKDKDKKDKKDKDHDGDKNHHSDQPGMPDHKDMKHMDPDKKPADYLNGLSGADFDAAYVHMMHRGHAELLEILDKKDDKVANANVKSFVSDVTSTVRKHRDEAAKMDTGKDKDGKDKEKDKGKDHNRDHTTLTPKEPAVKDPNWDR